MGKECHSYSWLQYIRAIKEHTHTYTPLWDMDWPSCSPFEHYLSPPNLKKNDFNMRAHIHIHAHTNKINKSKSELWTTRQWEGRTYIGWHGGQQFRDLTHGSFTCHMATSSKRWSSGSVCLCNQHCKHIVFGSWCDNRPEKFQSTTWIQIHVCIRILSLSHTHTECFHTQEFSSNGFLETQCSLPRVHVQKKKR